VPGSMNSARQYHLTYQDYLDIRKESPHIRAITPVLSSNDVHAVSEFASASGQLNGAEPQYNGIRFLPLKGEEAYDAISMIYYQPRVADEHLLARDEARRVLARNHHFDYHDEDAFESIHTVQQAQMMGTIFDAMNEFLGTVGLVTLALGAIGVINIMLIAVSERTREIGLRKALGATNRSIMLQFFAEGILLTVVSGLIGMGLAGGFMALLGNYNGPGGFDPPRLVPKTA